MKENKNKTILITGASSGIGETFAKKLDKYGARLILTARSEDKLIELASKMHNAHVIPGDLSDREFPDKAIDIMDEAGAKAQIDIKPPKHIQELEFEEESH